MVLVLYDVQIEHKVDRLGVLSASQVEFSIPDYWTEDSRSRAEECCGVFMLLVKFVAGGTTWRSGRD